MNDEEVRSILVRASQIQAAANSPVGESLDTALILQTADELGIDRDAVTKALQERLAVQSVAPKSGEFTWIKSLDGNLYVGEIVSIDGEIFHVKFLNGADVRVTKDDIRPLMLTPGFKVSANWRHWGWWTSSIVSADLKRGLVVVTDNWGTTETMGLESIRVKINEQSETGLLHKSKLWVFGVATGIGGGLIGALAMYLATK